MTTTKERVVFDSSKGNQFVETLAFSDNNEVAYVDKIIFTADSNLVDTHGKTARHMQSEIVKIKGRL